MFADLENYLEDDFLEANPNVTIVNVYDEQLNYTIFNTMVENVESDIFNLIGKDSQALQDYLASIDAPDDVSQLLVLATCIGNNDENRLLVLASLD